MSRAGLFERDVRLILRLLARDIERRPEAIKEITPALAARIRALTEGMEVDLDEEIEGDVAL
jgi:antitoxin PrlF